MRVIKCRVCKKKYDRDDTKVCPHCQWKKNSAQKILDNQKWNACQLSASVDCDNSKNNLTYEQALLHILEHSCSMCRDMVSNGGFWCEHEQDSNGKIVPKKEWDIVLDALDTMCGAEWIIETDESDKLIKYERLVEYIESAIDNFAEPRNVIYELIKTFKSPNRVLLEEQYRKIKGGPNEKNS